MAPPCRINIAAREHASVGRLCLRDWSAAGSLRRWSASAPSCRAVHNTSGDSSELRNWPNPVLVRICRQGWRQATGHGSQLICQEWGSAMARLTVDLELEQVRVI